VWAKKYRNDTKLYKAQIISITNNIYTIKFLDDNTVVETSVYGLFIYFKCNNNSNSEISIEEKILENSFSAGNYEKMYNGYAELACYLLDSVIQI